MWNVSQDPLVKTGLLLSCYDFRLSKRELEKSGINVYRALKRIPQPALHIAWHSRLGFDQVYAILKVDANTWHSLRRTIMVKNLRGIPFSRLVKAIAFFAGRTLYVSWMVPNQLTGSVKEAVEDWIRNRSEIVMGVGKRIPVWNCSGKLGLEEEIVEKAAKEYQTIMRAKPHKSRMPILDYIIVSVLDRFPLITISHLRKLLYAIQARIEERLPIESDELKGRYLYKYYKTLSRKKIIGRVWTYKLFHPVYDKLFLVMEPDDPARIYGGIASTLSAASIMVSQNSILSALLATPHLLQSLLDKLSDSILYTFYPLEVTVFPAPYELYHPIEKRWMDRPVTDLFDILRKMRLLDEQGRGGGGE